MKMSTIESLKVLGRKNLLQKNILQTNVIDICNLICDCVQEDIALTRGYSIKKNKHLRVFPDTPEFLFFTNNSHVLNLKHDSVVATATTIEEHLLFVKDLNEGLLQEIYSCLEAQCCRKTAAIKVFDSILEL